MSSTHSICPVCGATVRQSASEGLCPRCLLRAAVQPPGPTPEGDAADEAGTSPTVGPPPLRLGDYDLLAKLAEGGMGVVYKARQRSLNRLVALKLILAGRLATTDELRRFQTEAEAAARLDHPNIVPIYEVGLAEGRHFFAMKLIDGGPLSRPTDRRRPEASSARLLEQIARAVHHAHERGILHRDLKPANILIDAQGEPHVTDFGLARLAGSDSSVTLPGTIVGTPSFMAPEQAAAGAAELTTAADVYSLGAVLYFLITGQPPFTGRSATETIQRVLHEDPPKPATVAPGCDPELEIICLKCLEKDPAQRYRSALELAEDLARWQRHEPLLARPAGWYERTRKWVRRRPAWAALIAVSAEPTPACNERKIGRSRRRRPPGKASTRRMSTWPTRPSPPAISAAPGRRWRIIDPLPATPTFAGSNGITSGTNARAINWPSLTGTKPASPAWRSPRTAGGSRPAAMIARSEFGTSPRAPRNACGRPSPNRSVPSGSPRTAANSGSAPPMPLSPLGTWRAARGRRPARKKVATWFCREPPRAPRSLGFYSLTPAAKPSSPCSI
jgi:tRNA A-37 threonylcarbamoyl transferase component Bud32